MEKTAHPSLWKKAEGLPAGEEKRGIESTLGSGTRPVGRIEGINLSSRELERVRGIQVSIPGSPSHPEHPGIRAGLARRNGDYGPTCGRLEYRRNPESTVLLRVLQWRAAHAGAVQVGKGLQTR